MSRSRGQRRSAVDPLETLNLEARFMAALDREPDRAEEIHAEWIAEGRRQIPGSGRARRRQIVAGLDAIDRVYTECTVQIVRPAEHEPESAAA